MQNIDESLLLLLHRQMTHAPYNTKLICKTYGSIIDNYYFENPFEEQFYTGNERPCKEIQQLEYDVKKHVFLHCSHEIEEDFIDNGEDSQTVIYCKMCDLSFPFEPKYVCETIEQLNQETEIIENHNIYILQNHKQPIMK